MKLRLLWIVCGTSLGLASDCHGPPATPPPPPPSGQAAGDTEPETAPVAEPPPTRVDIGFDVVDPDRWLEVRKIRGDAPGAWATGSFDASRNKLNIETHDVAEFTIDTARIPIRWDRLVIIRIDGLNSELVKRDHSVYRFVLDEHGQWVVLER